MPTTYKPGDIVPISGLYGVVDQHHRYTGREVTCVKGHRFPPAPHGYGFVLKDRARH